MITAKTTLLSSLIGLTAVAFMTGCSAGANADSGSGHDPGTAGSAAGQAADAHSNGHIAGVLKWSGDSSGRHAYKTAECSAVPGGMLILDAPKGDKDLELFDQPHLRVAFMDKKEKKIAVGFFPKPKSHTKQNSFIGSGKSKGSVSWDKKGDTYVVHLRHLAVVSPDVKQLPDGSIDEHDYHATLNGNLTCTKVNGEEVKG